MTQFTLKELHLIKNGFEALRWNQQAINENCRQKNGHVYEWHIEAEADMNDLVKKVSKLIKEAQ